MILTLILLSITSAIIWMIFAAYVKGWEEPDWHLIKALAFSGAALILTFFV